MRFCDLFITYKVKRKDIKDFISFIDLPLYKKIAIVLLFSLLLFCGLSLISKSILCFCILCILIIFLTIIFIAIGATKKNLSKSLQQHYIPYSNKRMYMVIELLNEYKIDLYNQDIIDLLIVEARENQKRVDYISSIEKPLKFLCTLIIPIIAYTAQKISNVASLEETIQLAIETITYIIVFFCILGSWCPLVKEIINRDYNLHEDLISDLTQIKIFYSPQKKFILHTH